MTFPNRTPNAMDSILRPLLSALFVAVAAAALVLLAAPAGADQVAPIMKGKEQYKVPGAFKDKGKLPMSLMLQADGRLRVNVDDETWDLLMTGSGRSAQFQMTDAGFRAIEAAIANDLQGRYAKKLVDPSERARLDAMLAEQRELNAEYEALVEARDRAQVRLDGLRSSGGPVPFDLLRDLQAEVDRFAAQADEARREAIDLSVGIDLQRKILSPPFEVTITTFKLKLKINKPGTKAKVIAKIKFSAENLYSKEFFSGTRKVKGKGELLDLR